MIAEREDFPVLGGLRQVRVGVDEVMGSSVLGEEGQHRAGALRARGHVMLFQGRVVAPVHDGVEVQVEDRLAGGGQPGADHLLVQGGQEPQLVVMGQPVGVIGERGLLRQDRQPGQQRWGGVGEQVIDVGHAPGGGELEREQGQQPGGGRDDPGAGVAGCASQGGQVQGDQVRDREQQPGHGGMGARGNRTEVDDGGGRQPGVAAGGGRAGAGLRRRAADQPAESFVAQDVADRAAAQRGSLPGDPHADLIDRQAFAAQPDDPAAGRVLLRGALAARRSRRREHGHLPGPQIADQGRQRAAGVTGGIGGLLQRQALVQVGAQRLIPPLVHLAGQQLPSRPWGRYSGHTV